MKCDALIILFCIVSVSQGNVAKKVDFLEQTYYAREKRQDDNKWIWGYYDIPPTESNLQTKISKVILEETTEAPEEENPCDRPDPIMPDFRTPWRRISETKCYEFIWQIKLREARVQKDIDCHFYKTGYNYPSGSGGIGTKQALPGEYPHMVAIGWRAAQGTWIFKCGGSLISSKFVLTAAHCTRASSKDTSIADPVPKMVRLGDTNIEIDMTYYLKKKDANITRIIVHPQYNSPKKYFDIAVMELDRDIEFSFYLQPACLWGSFDTSPLGTKASFTGWGVVVVGSRTNSPTLQVGEVDIIDTDQCNVLLQRFCNRNWCGANDSQICAGKLAGGVDACQGDSGGPLQVKIPLPYSREGVMYYVIGVTSFGFSCAVANQPGLYTRVSNFIDWIEEVVWPAV